MNKEYIVLSVKEFAMLVDKSVKTVRNWIHDHKLHATRFAKGHSWDIELELTEYNRLLAKKEHRRKERKS